LVACRPVCLGFLGAFGPQLLNLSKAKKLPEAKSQKLTIMSFLESPRKKRKRLLFQKTGPLSIIHNCNRTLYVDRKKGAG
jgi:hypothetical protein